MSAHTHTLADPYVKTSQPCFARKTWLSHSMAAVKLQKNAFQRCKTLCVLEGTYDASTCHSYMHEICVYDCTRALA